MKYWPASLTLPRAPDRVIGSETDPYLFRWYVIPRNKWFNVYFHKFLRSDDPRALHDHPWYNMSIILWGEYLEYMNVGYTQYIPHHRGVGSIVFRRPATAHRVVLMGGNQPAWTLFITGPNIREWGFLCPNGWRHWHEFTSPTSKGNEVGRGCDD